MPGDIYERRSHRARRVDLDPTSRRPLGKYISPHCPAPVVTSERARDGSDAASPYFLFQSLSVSSRFLYFSKMQMFIKLLIPGRREARHDTLLESKTLGGNKLNSGFYLFSVPPRSF